MLILGLIQALDAVPLVSVVRVRLLSDANAREVEPLVGAAWGIAGDHIAIADILTEAVSLLHLVPDMMPHWTADLQAASFVRLGVIQILLLGLQELGELALRRRVLRLLVLGPRRPGLGPAFVAILPAVAVLEQEAEATKQLPVLIEVDFQRLLVQVGQDLRIDFLLTLEQGGVVEVNVLDHRLRPFGHVASPQQASAICSGHVAKVHLAGYSLVQVKELAFAVVKHLTRYVRLLLLALANLQKISVHLLYQFFLCIQVLGFEHSASLVNLLLHAALAQGSLALFEVELRLGIHDEELLHQSVDCIVEACSQR